MRSLTTEAIPRRLATVRGDPAPTVRHHRMVGVLLVINLPPNQIPFEVHAGLDAKDERELAWALNLHRRHLSREERREVVAKLKAEGKSNTQIAGLLGVDEGTIRNDLRECSVSENSDTEHPSTIERGDGKSYPATLPTPETLNARQEQAKALKAEGSSVRGIAQALGVSVGTVAADLNRPAVVSVLGATRAAEAELPSLQVELVALGSCPSGGQVNWNDRSPHAGPRGENGDPPIPLKGWGCSGRGGHVDNARQNLRPPGGVQNVTFFRSFCPKSDPKTGQNRTFFALILQT